MSQNLHNTGVSSQTLEFAGSESSTLQHKFRSSQIDDQGSGSFSGDSMRPVKTEPLDQEVSENMNKYDSIVVKIWL